MIDGQCFRSCVEVISDLDALQGFCRIDCQIATPRIASKAHAAAIDKEARFRDHAPLTIDYDLAA